MNNLRIYCTKIKDFRKSLKLTQKEFAENIGMKQANVSAIEKGKRLPTFEMIMEIYEYFKVSPNDLLDIPPPDKPDAVEEIRTELETLLAKVDKVSSL